MSDTSGTETRNAEAGGRRILEHLPFLVLFAVFVFVAVGGVGNYGMAWDDVEFYVGDRNLQFYKTLDSSYLDYDERKIETYQDGSHPDFYEAGWFQRQNPHHVWPLGVTLSAWTKDVFHSRLGWLDPISGHHLAAVFCGAALVLCVYGFAARHIGMIGALAAAVSLAMYPRFWAHLHYNVKDVVSCLFFCAALMAFFSGLRRDRASLLVLAGLCAGAAAASKANAVFLPLIALPVGFLEYRRRHRGGDEKSGATQGEGTVSSRPAGWSRKTKWALVALPFVSLAFAALCWPWILIDFPDRILEHLSWLRSRALLGPDQWQAAPLLKAVRTMPLLVLIPATVGFVFVVARRIRRAPESALDVLLLLWLIVPVLRVSVPGAYDYDGIRHWLEFVPAVALLVGVAAQMGAKVAANRWSLGQASRLRSVYLPAGLVLLWFSPVVAWNARNHPHEYVFFNRAVGGLKGAQGAGDKEATDYWCLSYRQGMDWLNENAAPNAAVVVSVGHHTVLTTRRLWLRDDIGVFQLPPFGYDRAFYAEMITFIRRHPSEVYVMTVTRREFYGYLAHFVSQTSSPIHEIRIDGGPILEIYRVDPSTLPVGG